MGLSSSRDPHVHPMIPLDLRGGVEGAGGNQYFRDLMIIINLLTTAQPSHSIVSLSLRRLRYPPREKNNITYQTPEGIYFS